MKRITKFNTVVFLILAMVAIHAAADELVLHLPFDEESGNIAKDVSPFGNDAVFQGNPQWIDGKFGKALELDGATWGEVADDPSLDLTDAMTIAVWALVQPGGEAIQSAVEKGDGWKEGEYNLAALYNDGSILQARDLPDPCNDENVGSSIQDGEWHYLAGTWDGSTLKLYIDGQLDAEMPCAGTLLTNDDPLFIGARGGTQRYLTGALDELKVYNYALSVEDIQLQMNNPNPTPVDSAGKLSITWGRLKSATR
jgi:hypothetical protein